MIRFACPSCDSSYSAAEEHAGKRTTCKKCGTKFLIPDGTDTPGLPYVVEQGDAPAAPVPEVPHNQFVAPAAEPPPPPLSVPVELNPCPTCQAKMSVHPEDVGFDIQCPFCQTTFFGVAAPTVPAATAGTKSPKPEPESIEIAPCPKCQAELTVAPEDLGNDVECPFCKTVYEAEKPRPKAQKRQRDDVTIDRAPMKLKVEKESEPEEVEEEDDDEYRPRKRRKKKSRKSRSRYDVDDDDSYDPDAKRYLTMQSSNGMNCLILGLVSFFCCWFVAFKNIPQCLETISSVNAGQMDASAKPLAIAGLTLSVLSIALTVLGIVLFVVLPRN